MSDEDIKTLGKSTSSSGVKSVATIMRIDTELHDARANVMNVTKIRDPNARRKALLHYQAANKFVEEVLLKEKDEDAQDENTNTTSCNLSDWCWHTHVCFADGELATHSARKQNQTQ